MDIGSSFHTYILHIFAKEIATNDPSPNKIQILNAKLKFCKRLSVLQVQK